MLVLSRRVSEKILIGENITVTIVRIGPNTCRVGIEAPGLRIVRDEIAHLYPTDDQQSELIDREIDL